MPRTSDFVDTAPSESRTRRMTRNAPAVAAAREIVPSRRSSFSPRGNVPLQRRGATPPRTATRARYALPAVADGRRPVAIASRGRTTSRSGTSRVAPAASTRCAVMTYEPARGGVPLSTPSAPTCNQAGAEADQRYGDWPPVPTSVARTGIPTSAVLRESVAASACDTVRLYWWESTRVPVKSFATPVAFTSNVDDPPAVGVPEITPSRDSVSPAGRAPPVASQVVFDGMPDVASVT